MERKTKFSASLLAAVLVLGGCVNSDLERGAAGAVVGGAAAGAVGGNVGTGAAVGALGGALCDDVNLC